MSAPSAADRRRGTLLAALVVGWLLTACQGAPGQSVELTASPTPMEAEACPRIDLRTPDGTAIELTGTWTGADGVLLTHQYDGCLWWELLSDIPGQALGESWRRLYSGTIHSDFTVVASFADILHPQVPALPGYVVLTHGEVVCEIAVGSDADPRAVIFRLPRLESVEGGAFPLVDYVRISRDTTLPPT